MQEEDKMIWNTK